MRTKRFFVKSMRVTAAAARQRLALVVLSVSLLTVLLLTFAGQASFAQKLAVGERPASGSSAAAAPVVTSYADVVSRVAPAVVTIRSEMRVRPGQGEEFPFPFPFPFGQGTPGAPQQRERKANATGSGVIVTADGYIVTNNHVVEDATTIRVELTDNRTFDAKVIGTDKLSDLAVLKIDATGLPVLPLGDSDGVRVGDVVLAIGNPLGIGQTVTSGIISAKGRSTGVSDGSYEDFLQTDAAINRGNSGGALVSATGELIGINSQILSPSGGNIGIGFAIPSNMARGVMDQLVKTGRVRRSKLGVGIQPVTADLAASLGLASARGAIVTQVEPGSPAERAGLRRGDVITAYNGTPVTDSNSLRNQVARTTPGAEATVTVVRDNREQQFKVTVSELTAEKAEDEGTGRGTSGPNARNTGKLGITVGPLTAAQASRLGLQNGATGVIVTSVDEDGPAADAGISQGDVIEEVNRQPVRTPQELTAALQRPTTRPVLLLVNRRGQPVYITVQPRQ